jgi:hypothetical protein
MHLALQRRGEPPACALVVSPVTGTPAPGEQVRLCAKFAESGDRTCVHEESVAREGGDGRCGALQLLSSESWPARCAVGLEMWGVKTDKRSWLRALRPSRLRPRNAPGAHTNINTGAGMANYIPCGRPMRWDVTAEAMAMRVTRDPQHRRRPRGGCVTRARRRRPPRLVELRTEQVPLLGWIPRRRSRSVGRAA